MEIWGYTLTNATHSNKKQPSICHWNIGFIHLPYLKFLQDTTSEIRVVASRSVDLLDAGHSVAWSSNKIRTYQLSIGISLLDLPIWKR